jgi:hypothetical protein
MRQPRVDHWPSPRNLIEHAPSPAAVVPSCLSQSRLGQSMPSWRRRRRVVGTDSAGRILLMIEAERLSGFGCNELIGQPVEMLVPEPGPRRARGTLRRLPRQAHYPGHGRWAPRHRPRMTPETLTRAIEPFFTTKDTARQRTRLATVYGTSINSAVSCASNPAQHGEPSSPSVCRPQTSPSKRRPASLTPAGGTETILVRRPDTKIQYMPGYAGDPMNRYGVLEPDVTTLPKPPPSPNS